jgi:pantetheine-phosphate adenylyltransferase
MFLITSLEYAYLSSTTVKEVASFGEDLDKFVQPIVAKALRRKLLGNEI